MVLDGLNMMKEVHKNRINALCKHYAKQTDFERRSLPERSISIIIRHDAGRAFNYKAQRSGLFRTKEAMNG